MTFDVDVWLAGSKIKVTGFSLRSYDEIYSFFATNARYGVTDFWLFFEF